MKEWDHEVNGEWFLRITQPCVYVWSRGSKYLYIGSSSKGIARLYRHDVIGKVDNVLPTDTFKFITVNSIHDARVLEKKLVAKYKPFYNGSFTGRAYVTSRIVERLLKPRN